jgi:hypothetical protein
VKPSASPTSQPTATSISGSASTTPTVKPSATPTVSPTATPRSSTSTSKKQQTITAQSLKKTLGTKKFKLNASTDGNGKITFSGGNKMIAVVSKDGYVTVYGCGKIIITVTAAGTEKYMKAAKKITLTILPKPVKGLKVTSPQKTKLLIKWSKKSGADKCEMQVSLKKTFAGAQSFQTNTKAGKYQIGKAKSRKTYYVRIRSYLKVDGKIYKSKWSKTKKVKVK